MRGNSEGGKTSKKLEMTLLPGLTLANYVNRASVFLPIKWEAFSTLRVDNSM